MLIFFKTVGLRTYDVRLLRTTVRSEASRQSYIAGRIRRQRIHLSGCVIHCLPAASTVTQSYACIPIFMLAISDLPWLEASFTSRIYVAYDPKLHYDPHTLIYTKKFVHHNIDFFKAMEPGAKARISADLLIPGRGSPIDNGFVVIEAGKIVHVGRQIDLPKEYADIEALHVPVLMPGLWDCHVHFYGTQKPSIDAFYQVDPVLAGARSAYDMAVTLRAGFTSVRELGGYGAELSRIVDEGTLVGPHIYSSVSPISMTAGHGDAHNTRLDPLTDAIHHGLPLHLCDGVDECLKAVRLQLRRGAKVIKVCASGGVSSQLDNPQNQQFSDAELKAMVDEAGRADRLIAAHCHGKRGIMAALTAGCMTIEHGSFLDQEAIEIMRERGVMLIATRTFFEAGLKAPELWTRESYAKLVATADAHQEAYTMAIAAGVKIALGTDLGMSGVDPSPVNRAFGHGKNGQELRYAVDAGMTPLQAIEAATANAPATLGLQAPLSGQLKAGYDADLIALSQSPLENIDLFADHENITHVWQGGKLLKSPEMTALAWP